MIVSFGPGCLPIAQLHDRSTELPNAWEGLSHTGILMLATVTDPTIDNAWFVCGTCTAFLLNAATSSCTLWVRHTAKYHYQMLQLTCNAQSGPFATECQSTAVHAGIKMMTLSAPISRRTGTPTHSRAVLARAEERTPSPAADVLEQKVAENKDTISKVTGVDPTLPSSQVDVDSGENTTVTNILSRTQELVNGRVRSPALPHTRKSCHHCAHQCGSLNRVIH